MTTGNGLDGNKEMVSFDQPVSDNEGAVHCARAGTCSMFIGMGMGLQRREAVEWVGAR